MKAQSDYMNRRSEPQNDFCSLCFRLADWIFPGNRLPRENFPWFLDRIQKKDRLQNRTPINC